jgi:TolA-binding protein
MLSKHIVPVLLTGTMIAFSTTNLAQAPVENRSVPANSNRSGPQAQRALSEDASVQLYLELQTLRQEVTALRGLIEELEHQIDQLSSRQTNDYVNLDRRILELSQVRDSGVSTGNSNPNSAVETTSLSSAVTPATGNNGVQASELYNRAFASLRSGDREAALSQFGDLVEQYPNDAVAGDALYWMGETQWVGAAYEDARQAFVLLTERFPEHRRYGDELYKLGLIYHQLGDYTSAQQFLQNAIELGGDVGARAEEFLSQNMTP